MTSEEVSYPEAIRPLVDELKAMQEILADTQQDIQHLTRNIQDYLSVIADSSDEIRSEILAAIRHDRLPKPALPTDETVTCAHCDAQADSLAAAVRDGFTALQRDDGSSSNYLGECSYCAAKMNTVQQPRQNLSHSVAKSHKIWTADERPQKEDLPQLFATKGL